MIVDPNQSQIGTAVLRNASSAEGYAPVPCHALNTSYLCHPDNAVLPVSRKAFTIYHAVGEWDPYATPA